jgi:glutamine amidotransferase
VTRGRVGIVDYGMGNLLSVRNALQALGAEVVVCREPAELREVERLVLPGVGAFGDCIRNLSERGLDHALADAVLGERKPILGICLGLQAFAQGSQEGEGAGLGFLAGEVVRLDARDGRVRVPHVGWNEVRARENSPMFAGIPAGSEFYFVHSYAVRLHDSDALEATSEHGETFAAAMRRQHVWGTQFHPEKSQRHGLRLLENFLAWAA